MTRSAVPSDGARLERIKGRFGEFAAEFAALPLYSAVCRRLCDDDELAALLLHAPPGQDRPVLWLAALHELVLRRPDVPAARWYASVVGREHLPTGDPWPDVRTTVLDHREELSTTMATRSTQTNEVNRCVYLAVALAMAAAAVTGESAVDDPVALVELGASAGLLLGFDRYDIELSTGHGTVQLGSAGSPVHCRGADRSGARPALPQASPVAGRVGIDRHPVRLDDEDAVRWLLACLWPDVPGRVERFTAARDLLLPEPPTVLEGDMVEALPAAVAAARAASPPSAPVVVYSSWALTYLHPDRRPDLEARFQVLAQEVSPLLWLTAEPVGCAPGIRMPDDLGHSAGTTVLGVREWRDGVELRSRFLGTCHPHGEWIQLAGQAGREGDDLA